MRSVASLMPAVRADARKSATHFANFCWTAASSAPAGGAGAGAGRALVVGAGGCDVGAGGVEAHPAISATVSAKAMPEKRSDEELACCIPGFSPQGDIAIAVAQSRPQA